MCLKISGYKNECGCSGCRLAAAFKFILNFVLNLKAYKQLKKKSFLVLCGIPLLQETNFLIKNYRNFLCPYHTQGQIFYMSKQKSIISFYR